jgi:hypothetical protein
VAANQNVPIFNLKNEKSEKVCAPQKKTQKSFIEM